MTGLNASNLPWFLIGVLVSAVIAVFYAAMKGKIVSSRVAELLRESAEKERDHLRATVDVNTKTIESLVTSVGKLVGYAESTNKALGILVAQHETYPHRREGAA